jgi:hypothetical protein
MNNSIDIQNTIKELIEGLSKIMEKSFPLCKNNDVIISNTCSKINNTAFELKQKAELLKKELIVND